MQPFESCKNHVALCLPIQPLQVAASVLVCTSANPYVLSLLHLRARRYFFRKEAQFFSFPSQKVINNSRFSGLEKRGVVGGNDFLPVAEGALATRRGRFAACDGTFPTLWEVSPIVRGSSPKEEGKVKNRSGKPEPSSRKQQ
jgi:hypothetical protein